MLKIRATIRREITDRINQNIDLSIIDNDNDNEDYERHIVTIPIDEIEISEDFVEYLYKGIEEEKERKKKEILK